MMKTTVDVKLPYKKSVLSDGTIEVAMPSLRVGILWIKVLTLPICGLFFAIFYLGDKISRMFDLGPWFIPVVLGLAVYIPFRLWRMLFRGPETKLHIVPGQGIRYDGKQIAFADMDYGNVNVISVLDPLSKFTSHHIQTSISGVKINILALANLDGANALAYLINQNSPRPGAAKRAA